MLVGRYVPWTPLRLVVAAICLEAVVALSGRPVERSVTVNAVPREDDQRPPAPHWLIKVDGWTFALDSVHRGYLRTLEEAVVPPVDESSPLPAKGGAIPYLDLIARVAAAEGIDWRVIVALISVESGFNATVESEAGAYGLMQVRPIAAQEVAMPDFYSPAANIRAGVRYLRRLLTMFPAVDPHDQLAMALAAYNMGPAHLSDAQVLAARYGINPRRWYDGLEMVLPLLEQSGIYRTLPNGFAQGRGTLHYVEQVLARYERLRRDYVSVAAAQLN